MCKTFSVIGSIILLCIAGCSNPTENEGKITIENQTSISWGYYCIENSGTPLGPIAQGSVGANSSASFDAPSGTYLLTCKPNGGSGDLSKSVSSGTKVTIYQDGSVYRMKTN